MHRTKGSFSLWIKNQCVNAKEIIDTLRDTKLNMTELITPANNLGEIWRNMTKKTSSPAILRKNGQKSGFCVKK